MSTKPPQPPNPVPEEDLNLHEDFSPVIAENGLIRQPKAPEMNEESLPAFLTRLDTLQDLVALRQAEQVEQQKQQKEALPPEGEDVRRADEGESKTKKNLIDKAVPPHPSSAHPLPQGRGAKILSPLGGKMPERADEEETTQAAVTTFLTVREAQTTALVPVSKLTLARRITLLKRKRQRKRRLATRAKKRAAQAATVPPKTPKHQPSPTRSDRWKWVFVVMLLLFLGGISGLVPVEKIPLLRNLAYAMGFDKNDTARISFLRALLTWADKTVGLPGNWSDEAGENYLWARRDKAPDTWGVQEDEADSTGLNARFVRADSQTSLIDMKALHALQLKKGYALDDVRGAVKLTPGQEEADLGPAVVRDDKVNVRTEANRDKGEVFFGSDRAAINRNFKDGYDSTKTLAKIKNPHIADGKPIDWLLNTTQQLMRTNGPLGDLNRQLEGTRVSWGDNIAGLGEQKPHKDLYHAWITSRMGNRTPNIMLKKSLVDVGFLGADMPTMASTALGGGVQIDSVSFQEDQEVWKEYLEFERKCKDELTKEGLSGDKINKALEDFQAIKDKGASKLGLPSNCYDALQLSEPPAAFRQNTDTVQRVCQDLEKGYETLEGVCGMQSAPSLADCDTLSNAYAGKPWENFKAACQKFYDESMQAWITENKTENYTPTEQDYRDKKWNEDGKQGSAQVIGKARETMLNTILTQGNREFATWIRATCDGNNCVPDDMKDGHSGQVEGVKNTIGEGISDVFKK